MSSLTRLAESLSSLVARLPDDERIEALETIRGLFVGIRGMSRLPEEIGDLVKGISIRFAVKTGSALTDAGREKAATRALNDLRAGASAELLELLKGDDER